MTDKITINNHEGDYVSSFIKQSASLTHSQKYPIVNEVSKYLSSFYFISYFATLFSKISLDLKNEILKKYAKFLVDWIDYVDGLNDIYILGNVDYYFPWLQKIQLKDLHPINVYNLIVSSLKDYYNFSVLKLNELNDNKIKPAIIKNTDTLIAPVNSKLSTIIDTYLPSETTSSSSSSSELGKFFNLLSVAYQRSKPLILGKYQNVKQYPGKIQSIYNEELVKNDQNVTKAITNTSIEISSKTLSTIGLSKANGTAPASNTPNGANGVVPNGEISVGA